MLLKARRGVLVVDKAVGPTSHDVVRSVRKALRMRAVGHAGTLDPLASGVLVIGVGEGTKLLNFLTADDKAYRATLRLGQATDSLDAQGSVVEERPVPVGLDRARVAQVARAFIGEYLQRAPALSAIKQAGEPLYARVRRGEIVIAPERPVVVRTLEIEAVREDEIDLSVVCGKGFYVRSLARDLAEALGTVGHLTALRRLSSGAFTLDDALPQAALTAAAEGDDAARAEVAARLLPLAAALRGCPQLRLSDAGVVDVRHGRPIVADRIVQGQWPAAGSQPVALVDAHDELVALGRAEPDRVAIVRGIAPAAD